MSDNLKISVPLDNDGFVSLQCPFCQDLFKITGTDFEADDIYHLYCPYCGLVSEDGFHSDDVLEHAMTVIGNDTIDKIAKSFKKACSNNKYVKFESKANSPKHPKILIEPTDMQEFNLKCCKKSIKIKYRVNGIYCPFCGVK